MKPYLTIGMLVISNIFMTFAWYGQLHLRGQRWFDTLPQLLVIVFCWSIAFFEYIFLVPANRIGHTTLSLGQLKIMQDRVSGERRALHAFPIENYSGGGFSHRVHRIRPDFFQNRDVPLEPSDGFRVHGDGGLFYF